MKNKFILAILLIVFGYKSSSAQITQSTVKSTNANNANVNVYQYSVTLTEDSTKKVTAPNASSPVRDDYYYPFYNLLITGMPNDTAFVTFQLFEKNIPSSPYITVPLQTTQVPIILDNYGSAYFKINKDNAKSGNPNLSEQRLCAEFKEKISQRIQWSFVGSNRYRLYASVRYFNKNLRDKKMESMVVF